MMVPKVKMVKMVILGSLEMMVPLGTQDLKDHVVIKVVMQLSEIVVVVHHLVLQKASKVDPVNQAILANLAILALKVLQVNLVDAFLVIVEILEMMVSQVMMESMANLVNQVSLEDPEMLLALKSQSVQILSLA